MEDYEQKTSKFSSGLNIIMRLDDLWKQTHRFRLEGRFNQWNLVLDSIWLELTRDYSDSKEDDFITKEEQFNSFDEKIINLGGINDTKKRGFEEMTPEDIKKRNDVYKELMKKQTFLARLENELGKGTTYEDNEDEDLD